MRATTTDDDETTVATRQERFTSFCAEVEPRLRRALVAAYGPDLGSDAAADAFAWAWEHFDRVDDMANPAGYLWRVGQTSVRTAARRRPWPGVPDRSDDAVGSVDGPAFEPALVHAMADLSLRQRTAVVLVHGYEYSLAEAAGVMGCRVRTLRNHLDRGLIKLRRTLGVTNHG
ncbi:MAG: RNA polymerase sigma factor [Acidimicrobiales bacterium]